MAADYTRGEMNITSQKNTFDGFIAVTLWSSLLMVVTLLYLTLVFAVGTDWMSSLIGVAIVGIVFGLICGALTQLFSAFLAG